MDTLLALSNPQIVYPVSSLGSIDYFNRIIAYIIYGGFVVCVFAFFILLVLGGISYVTSRGDKAALEGARTKILNALIGLVILFTLWLLLKLINTLFGINIGGLGVGISHTTTVACENVCGSFENVYLDSCTDIDTWTDPAEHEPGGACYSSDSTVTVNLTGVSATRVQVRNLSFVGDPAVDDFCHELDSESDWTDAQEHFFSGSQIVSNWDLLTGIGQRKVCARFINSVYDSSKSSIVDETTCCGGMIEVGDSTSVPTPTPTPSHTMVYKTYTREVPLDSSGVPLWTEAGSWTASGDWCEANGHGNFTGGSDFTTSIGGAYGSGSLYQSLECSDSNSYFRVVPINTAGVFLWSEASGWSIYGNWCEDNGHGTLLERSEYAVPIGGTYGSGYVGQAMQCSDGLAYLRYVPLDSGGVVLWSDAGWTGYASWCEDYGHGDFLGRSEFAVPIGGTYGFGYLSQAMQCSDGLTYLRYVPLDSSGVPLWGEASWTGYDSWCEYNGYGSFAGRSEYTIPIGGDYGSGSVVQSITCYK